MSNTPAPSQPLRLYPEYNLAQIELLYHDALAALNVAAEEKTGTNWDQMEQQIVRWYDKGKARSGQSAQMRRQRNLMLAQTARPRPVN